MLNQCTMIESARYQVTRYCARYRLEATLYFTLHSNCVLVTAVSIIVGYIEGVYVAPVYGLYAFTLVYFRDILGKFPRAGTSDRDQGLVISHLITHLIISW